jgi:hypothetical protein
MIKDKSDTLKLTLGNKVSIAAYFDGGVNYVNITATSTLNAISDTITMEAWVKPQIQFYNIVIAKELTGNESGLTGYWDLNQIISEATISDISGHNHNDLLSGSVILIDSYAFY